MLLICNGMIRSGSTLQYNLVRNLVEELGVGEGIGFFSPEQMESKTSYFAKLAVDKKFYVMKIHEKVPGALLDNDEFKKVSFLYIYRDIRDVAVSLKNKLKCDGDDLVERLDDAIALSNEIQSYPNVLCQKYEDVYSDMNEAIAEQARYIGLDISAELVDKIADTCSIKNIGKNVHQGESNWRGVIKRVLMRVGILDGDYDRSTLIHSNHISKDKGKVGTWKSQLSPGEKAMMTERYSSWLLKYNYKS